MHMYMRKQQSQRKKDLYIDKNTNKNHLDV